MHSLSTRKQVDYKVTFWRDGRVVDYNGLENRRTERYRGFESLSLRKQGCKSTSYVIYTLYYTQNFGETIFTDCIENPSKDFCLRLWIIGFRNYWKIKIFGILLINMLRTSNNHHRLICIHFICKRFI